MMRMSKKPHPMSDSYRHLNLLVCEDNPKIFIVALDRPRRHNALNARLWKEIGHVFSKIGRHPHYCPCRCVLLVGNGPSFCAGIDFSDPSFLKPLHDNDNNNNDMDVARAGYSFVDKLQDMQEAFSVLETQCPVPVVAAAHGNIVGAGVDLLTATQIRLCSAEATFCVKEVALGLAADVGTLQRLPKCAGSNQSLIHEVCYTGRKFSATEALQMGLVSRIIVTTAAAADNKDELLFHEALQLCHAIARHSPLAVHGTKKGLLYSRDHSVEEGLQQIAAYNQLALQGPDIQVAFMAAAAAATTSAKKGSSPPDYSPSFDDLPPKSRL